MSTSKFSSIHEIIAKYNNGGYDPEKADTSPELPLDTVLDENMSVKWNRDQVQLYNDKIKQARADYKKRCKQLMDELDNDIVELIMQEYGLNVSQAKFITAKAYEDKHSCTTDYIYEADSLAEFFVKVSELS